MKYKQPDNKESLEQQSLFKWAAFASGKYPELDLMYHIPNEGKRSKAAGAKLKAEGLKSGVPDICLPVARGKYHGLYIEMKREHSGTATDNQEEWIENLIKQEYFAIVCHGWEAAQKVIISYLELKK